MEKVFPLDIGFAAWIRNILGQQLNIDEHAQIWFWIGARTYVDMTQIVFIQPFSVRFKGILEHETICTVQCTLIYANW